MRKVSLEIEVKGRKIDVVYDGSINTFYPKEFERKMEEFKRKIFLRTVPKEYPKNVEEVRRYVISQNKRLIFEISQNCNLKCKYCFLHSGLYLKKNLNQDVIPIKQVRKFLKFYRELNRKPSPILIGFYGGEPTIYPHKIVQIVNICREELNKELMFYISTNGTFAQNKELLDFLLRNNFYLQISIDGPKEENDKFRTFPSGRGSFEAIEKLLRNIKFYPKVRIILTLHPFHNWEKMEDFFRYIKKINPSWHIELSFVNVDEIVKDEVKKHYKKALYEKITDMKTRILEKLERGLNLNHFEESFLNFFEEFSFKITILGKKGPFHKSCFPGEDRLYISSSGNIKICERVSDSFTIGHLEEGLNFKRILRFWNFLNEISIQEGCATCPFVNLCSRCFARLTNDFKIQCNEEKRDKLKSNLEFFIKVKLLEKFKGGKK